MLIIMAAQTAMGSPRCKWQIKRRMRVNYSSTKVASYKKITVGKAPEDSKLTVPNYQPTNRPNF